MWCRCVSPSQVSFHRYGDYFPGTGAVEDVGYGKGRGYCVNVPLKDGMDDESYRYVYEPIMTKVGVGQAFCRRGSTAAHALTALRSPVAAVAVPHYGLAAWRHACTSLTVNIHFLGLQPAFCSAPLQATCSFAAHAESKTDAICACSASGAAWGAGDGDVPARGHCGVQRCRFPQWRQAGLLQPQPAGPQQLRGVPGQVRFVIHTHTT